MGQLLTVVVGVIGLVVLRSGMLMSKWVTKTLDFSVVA